MDNVDRATTRVFVTNYQERDFASAEQFGEPIYITRGFVPLKNMEALRRKLQKFVDMSSPQDYVILTGSAVIISMFSLMWGQKHGFMNVLSWNNQTKKYKHFVVSPEKIQDGAD